MKKKFEKPTIESVELALSTAICNCGTQVTLVADFECGGYDDDVNLLYQDGLFTSGWNCSINVQDGMEIGGNGKCYHTSVNSVFSS